MARRFAPRHQPELSRINRFPGHRLIKVNWLAAQVLRRIERIPGEWDERRTGQCLDRQSGGIRVGDDTPVGIAFLMDHGPAGDSQTTHRHLIELAGGGVAPQQISFTVAGEVAIPYYLPSGVGFCLTSSPP